MILVLEPSNPEGQQACNELINQVALLSGRFEQEMANKDGTGLAKEDSGVLKAHIDHLMPLYDRMRVLGNVLEYLSHRDFTAAPQAPNANWAHQYHNFQDKAQPFLRFLRALMSARTVQEQLQAQIQSALCTGEWDYLDSILEPGPGASNSPIPGDVRDHRAFRWLKTQLEANKRLRAQQVRRRDEILACLTWQVLETKGWDLINSRHAQPNASSQPNPDGGRDVAQRPLQEAEARAWADQHIVFLRAEARTPVEVKSLLEVALELLAEMCSADEGDKCCVQQEMSWREPITHQEKTGLQEIGQALAPLLVEIDALRQWLQPITGGRLPATWQPAATGPGAPSTVADSGAVEWPKLRDEVDELRQKRRFPDAIERCQLAVFGAQHSAGADTEHLRNDAAAARPVTVAQQYLRTGDPLGGRRPYTGMGQMLIEAAKQWQSQLGQGVAEGVRAIELLGNMRSEYEKNWQTFKASLRLYLSLRRKARLPLLGRAWKDRAADAQRKASQAFEDCYAICPKDPNLLAQQGLLDIMQLPEVRPLWKPNQS